MTDKTMVGGPDITAARLALAPGLVEALRASAKSASDLADELEREPGLGVGLSYAKVRRTAEEADEAMMQYQNDPVRRARLLQLNDLAEQEEDHGPGCDGPLNCTCDAWCWPAPDGNGWVDAWNRWYPGKAEALDSERPFGHARLLEVGEGLLDPAEAERRLDEIQAEDRRIAGGERTQR